MAKDIVMPTEELLKSSDKITSYLDEALKQQREEIREMIGESLSVDELKGEMGACYSTLNVQVAFKEGFNHKGKELLKALDNLD